MFYIYIIVGVRVNLYAHRLIPQDPKINDEIPSQFLVHALLD